MKRKCNGTRRGVKRDGEQSVCICSHRPEMSVSSVGSESCWAMPETSQYFFSTSLWLFWSSWLEKVRTSNWNLLRKKGQWNRPHKTRASQEMQVPSKILQDAANVTYGDHGGSNLKDHHNIFGRREDRPSAPFASIAEGAAPIASLQGRANVLARPKRRREGAQIEESVSLGHDNADHPLAMRQTVLFSGTMMRSFRMFTRSSCVWNDVAFLG